MLIHWKMRVLTVADLVDAGRGSDGGDGQSHDGDDCRTHLDVVCLRVTSVVVSIRVVVASER